MNRHLAPRRRAAIAVAVLAALAPAPALAHAAPGSPLNLRWTVEPLTLAGFVALCGVYWAAVERAWERHGRWRLVRRRDLAALIAGLALLAVCLFSPLHAAGEQVLSLHMFQHCLLTLAVAPLLVLGRSEFVLATLLPARWRRPALRAVFGRHESGTVRAAVHPLTASAVFTLVFWAWHAPPLYDAAINSEILHASEHATMLASALLFWHCVLRRAGTRGVHPGLAALLTFAVMLQMSALSGLMVFSGSSWYGAYAALPPNWPLSPLDDQHLGGLVMWGISGPVFFATIAWLVVRWFRQDERRNDARAGAPPALAPPAGALER